MKMEKINLVELLKDCPSGMELNCTMFENVKLLSVYNNNGIIFPITVLREDGKSLTLTKYGQYIDINSAKCVIFPKGKTTWEGFHRPFKGGDIVVNASNEDSNAFIYAGEGDVFYEGYVGLTTGPYPKLSTNKSIAWVYKKSGIRFATEEEKEKLFDAIKANGYKWNSETKTLEKLVESKFDITTLKPFDKVLIRDNGAQMWSISFFSHCNGLEAFKFSCINGNHGFEQCIPYEGNEHLLGTYDDCDEYFKNWK